MKKLALTVAACATLFTGPLSAQNTPESVPIPVDAATIDFSGVWSFSSSNHTVSGRCPEGTPMVGTLSISQPVGTISLQLLSGAKCDPASMCSYSGEIRDGNIAVSNTDVVDEEGGEVTNAMNLFFFSDAQAGGNASSRYLHPKGFECIWEFNLELSRPE